MNFAHVVDECFGFLLTAGFERAEVVPTRVSYRRGDVEFRVYHGRKSFEIGVEFGRIGEKYSLPELLRMADPRLAESYRNPIATTPGDVLIGVGSVAGLVRQYGKRALEGDAEIFDELSRRRTAWSESYALDVLAEQIRPKAEAAFRDGRYKDAAELYERIYVRLSSLERRKLAAARERG